MKKLLLFCAALCAAAGLLAQNQTFRNGSTTNMVKKIEARQDFIRWANETSVNSKMVTSANENSDKKANEKHLNITAAKGSQSSQVVTWQKISGSMNVYGVLEISGKPLQYNNELNAVSFVHRKSQTYLPSPVYTPSTAASGAIVAMVTTNCGTTWDSTLVWNNSANWARYPQGGIYNPPGNTNIANAHIAVSGPVTAATNSWVGSYLASKPLAVSGNTALYNNIASTVANAQQFVPNSGTLIPVSLGKFDYPSYSFSSTDDGLVRTLGIVVADFNATGSGRKYTGAKIIKGSYTSGTFNWTGDDFIIAPLTLTNTSGDLQVLGEPHMAWNESGTVGYVVQFGCRNGATGSESGFQPIVYKTTNSGSTWTLMPAISFSAPNFQSKVIKPLEPAINSTVAIPFFNINEGVSCVVDSENKLHIVSTLLSTRSTDSDSLGFVWNYNNPDFEVYSFPFTPGRQPYIYDFMETSTGWDVMVVDSMTTEGPGDSPGEDGFLDNPWDATGGAMNDSKVISSARIQASRTPDGKFIIYSWAESDINNTASGKRWNSIPNIKLKAYSVESKQLSINKSDITTTSAVEVASRAQMHHVSPTSIFNSINASWTQVNVSVPVTITNNQNSPLTQQLPNDHWYTCSASTFTFAGDVRYEYIIGINSHESAKSDFYLYPNPCNDRVNLSFNSNEPLTVNITITNSLGQTVGHKELKTNEATNSITLETGELNKGIYFVNVNQAGKQTTLKLIKE